MSTPLDRLRRHPVAVAAVVLGGTALAVGMQDSRLDPVAWDPPSPPRMAGALEENRELTDLRRVVALEGPEDVAFDDEGSLYAGTDDGAIHRTVDPVGPGTTDAETEVFARTDGRPLGIEFDGDRLLVAAIDAGLLSIDPDRRVTTLADTAGGQSIGFADDIHVADDGTIYFTDATVHDQYQDELFELRDTGRLLAHDPETGETTVERGGLGFANGLVPGPDGDSLLITETSRYRVTRYWIRGDRAGDSGTFAENLPGYPDNVDVADEGYWVAIPAPRSDLLDRIQRHPWVVEQLGKLPESVLAQVEGDPYGLVVRLDEAGAIVESLHDPTGDNRFLTSATPHEGTLYLGTLVGDGVYAYPLDR